MSDFYGPDDYLVVAGTGLLCFRVDGKLGARWMRVRDAFPKEARSAVTNRRNSFIQAHHDHAAAFELFLSIEESRRTT